MWTASLRMKTFTEQPTVIHKLHVTSISTAVLHGDSERRVNTLGVISSATVRKTFTQTGVQL